MNLPISTGLRRIILISCGIVLFLFVLFFSLRGLILRKALEAASRKMKSHHYIIHWEGAAFKGLKSVHVSKIYIQNEFNANEIDVDSLSVNVRITQLIFRKIRLKQFECARILVTWLPVRPDSLKPDAPSRDTSGFFQKIHQAQLADLANKNIRLFFGYVPSKVFVRRLETRVTYEGKTTMVGFSDLKIAHSRITGNVEMQSLASRATILIDGKFSRSSYLAEILLVNSGDSLLPLEVMKDKYGVEAGFDTIKMSIDMSHRSRKIVNLSGSFSVAGLELGGARISSTRIRVDHFNSDFLMHVGQHFVEVDSSTNARLNRIRINPYVLVQFNLKPDVTLKLLPVTWEAGAFFASLPPGMFTSVTGLKAQGLLHFSLNFHVDMANADSLKFSTSLAPEKFRILAYGTDDFRKMNGSFYYEVYEKGIRKAAFIVGNDNPEFVPFDNISPFLRAAVMTSEDGSFFYHAGFNPEAFRQSMVTNIKEKRFARGGSTISMQLVKNVYLTRNKNFSRKIEEALIVWMIENQHLVSKKRMYEIYLNLIEWGPGVYGINQASYFYFNKKPADLTLQESIFLASIVPHPKYFRYTFETNGVPKSFFGNYFSRMKELMVRKQFIAATDTIHVQPYVFLTGPAVLSVAEQEPEREDINLQQLDIIPGIVE